MPAVNSSSVRRACAAGRVTPPGIQGGAGGFTLLEMLVVVTIVAVLVGLTAGVTGSLRSSRGNTATHQLAAVLDSARAKALTGVGEVVVAFATNAVSDPRLAYRAVVICQSRAPGRTAATAQPSEIKSEPEFEPVSGWFLLPEGFVFALAYPADADAGVNVLNALDAIQLVSLPGNEADAKLPCIGFRELGAVSLPLDTRGRPVLVAIAEGVVEGGNPVSPMGLAHTPDMCRWLAVQKNSGNTVILP